MLKSSSSFNAADATMDVTFNGQATETRSGVWSHHTSDGTGGYNPLAGWNRFKPCAYQYFPNGDGWWFDSLIVDDSWCRILVSDQASWSTANQYTLEMQAPMVWSNTSVQFMFRQGALSSLAGKFLWVVTNDNVPIRIGQFT